MDYLEARIVYADGGNVASYESERYAVEGYDFIRGHASRVEVRVVTLGVLAGLAVVGGMLLVRVCGGVRDRRGQRLLPDA